MIRMIRMAGWRYRLPTSPARAKPQRRPRASHQARWPPDGSGGRRRFPRACDQPSARPPRTQPSGKPGSSWDVSYASLKFTAGRQIHYSGDLFGRVGIAFEFGQQADGEGAVAGVEFGTGGCGQMAVTQPCRASVTDLATASPAPGSNRSGISERSMAAISRSWNFMLAPHGG